MSEDAPTPEAQDEQPQKKPAAKAAKQARKKSVASKSGKGADKKDTPKAEAGDDNKAVEGASVSSKTPAKQVRRGRTRGRGRQEKSPADEPKLSLNRKTITKRAWKIFLGEVNEEGLALVADKDARELARRSLRIAEIYTREEELEAGKKNG